MTESIALTKKEEDDIAFLNNRRDPTNGGVSVILYDDTEKARLVGQDDVEWGLKVLPKQDCGPPKTATVSSGSGNRHVVVFDVKSSMLGSLLSGLLFTERIPVAVYNPKTRTMERANPDNYDQVAKYLDASFSTMPRPVAAIHIEKLATPRPQVGVFIIDKVRRTFTLASFEDDVELDTLDGFLDGLNPSECFVSEKVSGKLSDMLTSKKLSLADPVGRPTKPEDAFDGVAKFVDTSHHNRGKLERDERISLLASQLILPMLDSTQTYTLHEGGFADFMKLSASTLEGLHVFGPDSLFSTLNHTKTSAGERMLKSWMRQPLISSRKIQRRLDLVERFFAAKTCRKSVGDLLRRVPDFEVIVHKFDIEKVTLMDLFKAYGGVEAAKSISTCMREEFDVDEIVGEAFIVPLTETLKKLEGFQALISKTLDFDALRNGESRVRATFDETLTGFQKELDGLKKKIEKAWQRDLEDLGMNSKALKLESTPQNGHYYRVTLKEERHLRQKKGLHFFDSSKAGVKFRSRDLEILNAEYGEVVKKYELHQQYVIDEVMKVCQGYDRIFLQLSLVLSELDCLVSFANAAAMAPSPYTKPTINSDGRISMKKARHPVMEQKGCINFIPNDVELSQEKNFVVITGPNLGGKSTYLRMSALSIFMAQIGSFVPCLSADISPVDNILVRIGASDSQYHGISTFMSEMLDASQILRRATSQSLVLVDEIGRGTSTYDGFGLAWAISHHISTKIKAPTLFATHFQEMTGLSTEVANVINYYCDAIVENGQLTLLYSIGPGICEKSFGIEVAEMAGFPKDIINEARDMLQHFECKNRDK